MPSCCHEEDSLGLSFVNGEAQYCPDDDRIKERTELYQTAEAKGFWRKVEERRSSCTQTYDGIRNFTPNMKEEQRAILTRTLYYKVLFSLPEMIENVEALAKRNCFIFNVLYFLIYDHGFKICHRLLSI